MMTDLYRLVEKYENPPEIDFQDEAEKYFADSFADIMTIYNGYPDIEFAKEFAVGLYECIDKRFQKKYKLPLMDRAKAPKQEKMF